MNEEVLLESLMGLSVGPRSRMSSLKCLISAETCRMNGSYSKLRGRGDSSRE